MDAPSSIRIRRIRPDDGLTLRDLRLRSIADAPDAFGQPIDEARARPEEEWHRSARESAHGDNRAWLIAELGGDAVGLVQGRRRPTATLLLFSMWVEHSSRRLGVGRLLVEALETWASGWDAQETILWVFGGNASAIQFYRDLGFAIIRGGPDAESGARFAALAMCRPIGPSMSQAIAP